MKIFDCFLYCNEDIILDVRLNILNKFVDKFIIVESQYYHNGDYKGLNFNIKNFTQFKDKIIYISVLDKPKNLQPLSEKNEKNDTIKILNAVKFENEQRNRIFKGLKDCSDEDIVIISDVDEIPNLDKINVENIGDEAIFFEQKYFYYKFNLFNPKLSWTGSRLIKKKNLKSPQWLRNLKTKKYSIWRVDKLFNSKIYSNFKIIKNGGWHFSYLNNAEGVLNKLSTYLHYVDFEYENLDSQKIKQFIDNKTPIYDLGHDQRGSKLTSKTVLDIIEDKELPTYLQNNKEKFSEWFI
jgi:beta-1,4-mannosyl-glycoprotein beta-1,4-N-acetylglucosaminyltransferase